MTALSSRSSASRSNKGKAMEQLRHSSVRLSERQPDLITLSFCWDDGKGNSVCRVETQLIAGWRVDGCCEKC